MSQRTDDLGWEDEYCSVVLYIKAQYSVMSPWTDYWGREEEYACGGGAG